jgi:hypothetical protein
MKLKPKKKTEKTKPLGTFEQLKDPEYLPQQRNIAKATGALEGYCEMLETQINALVDKILSVDTSQMVILSHPESNAYIIGRESDVETNPELIIVGSPEDLIEQLTEKGSSSNTEKCLTEARKRINSASNELGLAQQYIRDNL